MSKIEFVDPKVYREMNNVMRLNGKKTIQTYSLAEHSYHVVVLFKYFADKMKIPYDLNTIFLILSHDLLEVVTSDLPWNIKNLNVRTQAMWEAIEEEVAQKAPELRYSLDETLKNKLTSKQYRLFKDVDLLELYMFLLEEIELGNRNLDLQHILETCDRLVTTTIIKKYMRGLRMSDKGTITNIF